MSRRSLGRSLWVVGAAALAGCGAATGADVTLLGADTVAATQISLVGTVGDELVRMGTVPELQRPLGRREDVRVLLADRYAGQVLVVRGTPIVSGVASGTSVEAAGTLVLGRTRQIVLCFDAAGCGGE